MKLVPHGEPYAGKRHVRFDEGAGVPHGASRSTLHPYVPSGISATEYVIFATLCFSTVLPAVTAIAAWLGTFRIFSDDAFADMMRVNLRSPVAIAVMAALSVIGLTGIVIVPQFAYPLLWISPLMVFVIVQLFLKEPCSLNGLASGNWSLVIRFATAAFICGLVWETWNFYSMAKWIYAVPYVHRFQIWEMPILGFAGYLPFGMECAAVAGWISTELIESPLGSLRDLY